jgi:lysine-N-methylase
VDKKTFLKYRDVGNAELQPLIDQVVKRYRGADASDQHYGIFRPKADGSGCLFLTPDKLCRLHGELGYDRLCDVCAVYPRLYKLANGKLERCATLSCPEAARMALLNPEGIAFESVEEDASTGRVPLRVPAVVSSDPKLAGKPVKFFWEIRMFCLALLQSRDYTVGQRMIILGMVIQKIAELEKDGRGDDIPAMLEKLGASAEDGALRPELDKVEKSYQIQVRIAKELTDNRMVMGLVSSRDYINCIKDTLIGLNFIAGTSPDKIIESYSQNSETYVAEYLKDKEYLLENFIVNEFFMRMIPFGSGENVWDSYLFMCVIYAMIKLHLNGMAGCHKGLTDEIVVNLVQSFSKVVLHNTKFIPNMVRLLKDSGFDSLACMTILVND